MKLLYILNRSILLIPGFLFFALSSWAQFDNSMDYIKASRKAAEADVAKSLEIVTDGYNKFPRDYSMSLHYARVLSWNSQYDSSLVVLNHLVNVWGNNIEIDELKLDILFWSSQWHRLIKNLNQVMNQYEIKPDYLYKKAIAFENTNRIEEGKEILETLLRNYPDHGQGIELMASLSEKSVQHGIISQVTVGKYSDQFDPWYLTRLGYWYSNKGLKVATTIGLGSRYNQLNYVADLESYLNLGSKTYLFLAGSYSPKSPSFRYHVAGEVFHIFFNTLETSIGMRYFLFEKSETFVYNFQIGKYMGNEYFSIRPNMNYQDGLISYSGNVTYRHYFENQNYIGINAGYGFYLNSSNGYDAVQSLDSKGIIVDSKIKVNKGNFIQVHGGIQIDDTTKETLRYQLFSSVRYTHIFKR